MRRLSSLRTVIGFFFILVLFSCSKKDNPSPASSGNPGTPSLPSGSIEGSITMDGTTTSISGNSVNSNSGFVMYARNMNPPNSYPVLNVDFGSRPMKDSTYTINTNNFVSISVGNNTNTDNYIAVSGTIVVDVVGDYFTATVTNLIVANFTMNTKIISGSVKYYY